MDGDMILLKSLRGREELRTRAHDLSPLERRLLIVANGRTPVKDLAHELDRTLDDPELNQALQHLIEDRYVHILDEYDTRD